jgi:hypothetical protein
MNALARRDFPLVRTASPTQIRFPKSGHLGRAVGHLLVIARRTSAFQILLQLVSSVLNMFL